MAQTIDNILQYKSIDPEALNQAVNNAVDIIGHNLNDYTYNFQEHSATNGFYKQVENSDWTTGFFTGELWLAYELSSEEKFKDVAEIHVQSFLNRIENRIRVDHHDMGFLYSLSCVSAYKLTGNPIAKRAALLAADNLLSRFHEVGEFIQAWGDLNNENEYRLIIDCLLNLPLLYWASEVTGDEKYKDKAQKHIKTAMKCIIREDNSTYHTHYFDPQTGQPTKGVTVQGNRDGSAWARGQAWGVYGSALSYKYLKNPEYMETFKKITEYFLEHLPDDLIPYWDFDFDTGSSEPRDSSALAIAICGILEMSKYMDKDESEKYATIANKLTKALVDQCANNDISKSNGLLLHGVYARSTDTNPCNNRGVDECNSWGDYFYLELLTRQVMDWNLYW